VLKLSDAPPEARAKAREAFLPARHVLVEQLRGIVTAEKVSFDNLPKTIKGDWITADGQSRIEVTPKNLSNANHNLKRFSDAVLAVAPEATGGPVVMKDSGDSVVKAFIEAGIWALLSIAILLYVVLRRITDVLLTLVPLLLAGVLTLEITVLADMPLNFANIIALPLLLGLGVAFKIYFVLAWREGQTHVLQSSLTRAVFFSAMCTAVAFGSLWSSAHPGTSSMGKLLALSLACTLISAVFFQPALMGPPRQKLPDPDKAARPLSKSVAEAAE
jgi:predicted RND superfamily exporter protein